MLLARTEVLPHYTQVEISDPAKTDYPQWATGKEPAVATPQCIAVAARPDHLGNVAIELWQDEMNHTSLRARSKTKRRKEVCDASKISHYLYPGAIA